MPHEFLDDVTSADVAFRARGPDLGALFTAAAEATMEVMIPELDSIAPRERRRVALRGGQADLLLLELLQELIYWKDAQRLLLRVVSLRVEEDRTGGLRLQAELAGERLDPARHRQGVDVKAVTLHRLEVARDPRGWSATVVLDV